MHRPGQKPCKICNVGIWLIGLLVEFLSVIFLSISGIQKKTILSKFVISVVQLIPPNVIKIRPVIIPCIQNIQVRRPLLIRCCDSLDILCRGPWDDEAETTTRESQLEVFRTHSKCTMCFFEALRIDKAKSDIWTGRRPKVMLPRSAKTTWP
jgi:hypothetical protein